jgi:hypothetical protein
MIRFPVAQSSPWPVRWYVQRPLGSATGWPQWAHGLMAEHLVDRSVRSPVPPGRSDSLLGGRLERVRCTDVPSEEFKQREVVHYLKGRYEVSQRRAVRAARFCRSSLRYESRRDPLTVLRQRMASVRRELIGTGNSWKPRVDEMPRPRVSRRHLRRPRVSPGDPHHRQPVGCRGSRAGRDLGRDPHDRHVPRGCSAGVMDLPNHG